MFCLLAFAVVVIVVALIGQTQWAGSLNRAYSAVAERYAGRFRKTWLPCRPAVHFTDEGIDVSVRLTVKRPFRPRYTRVQIVWPDRSFRCSVFPDQPKRKKRFPGMQDIEVGNTAFDLRFVITGNDEARVRQMLGIEVQQQINTLYHLPISHQVYVAFSNGRLLIIKRGAVRQPRAMLKLVEHCLALARAAMASDNSGIEFLAPVNLVKASDEEGVVCQICGDRIDDEVVYCRSCKTPHHDDCWEYYGACSTYGCGQTKYTK